MKSYEAYVNRVLKWASSAVKRGTVQVCKLSDGKYMIGNAYFAYVVNTLPDVIENSASFKYHWQSTTNGLYERMIRTKDRGTPLYVIGEGKIMMGFREQRIYDLKNTDPASNDIITRHVSKTAFGIVKPVTKWINENRNIIVCFDDDAEPIAALSQIVRR